MKTRFSIFLLLFILTTFFTKAQNLNFYDNIAPIIYTKCSPCHQGDSIAPFPLMNYSDVKKRLHLIRYATLEKLMPPWQPDPNYSNFRNENYLTDSEINLIGDWIAEGAVEGSKECEPEHFYDFSKNKLGKPDLVYTMKEEYLVRGTNTDDYRAFVIPSGLPKDIYIKAIQFSPGNYQVVHHNWIIIDTLGIGKKHEEEDYNVGFDGQLAMEIPRSNFFLGYLPGINSVDYPHGTGKLITANSDIIFSTHYAPSAINQIDKSKVFMYLLKEPFERKVKLLHIAENYLTNKNFIIPAGKVKQYTTSYPVKEAMSILTVIPHTHKRATSFKSYSINPQNDTIPIIKINNWDFNWQGAYTYEYPLIIEKNSTVITEVIFDNTESNPFNPYNPPLDAKIGIKSSDEMLVIIFEYLDYQKGDETIKF